MGLVSVLLDIMRIIVLIHANLAVQLYLIVKLVLLQLTAQHVRLGIRLTPLPMFVMPSPAKLLIALIVTLRIILFV